MDVLICAAGSGSRLAKYTHDIIPKFLVNLDYHTSLYYILNYWNKYANKIYLVINSSFNLITKFYINTILKNLSEKVVIINYDSCDGTAYTLNNIINNELKNEPIKNLMVSWCDIYPDQDLDFKKLNEGEKEQTIYIMTYGNKCRYKFDEYSNKIHLSPKCDGNIIGIYYFQNYQKFILDSSCYGKDIIDFLDSIGKIKKYNIEKIIDYGDEEKLLNIINDEKNNRKGNDFHCRVFNHLELINDDKILKKGIDDTGKRLIKNEKKWYESLNELITRNNDVNDGIRSFIPKIYKFYEFGYLMELKKNQIPLFQFFEKYEKNIDSINIINISEKQSLSSIAKNNVTEILKRAQYNIIKNHVIKNVIDKLSLIHNCCSKIEPKLSFLKNLKIEIFDKVYQRREIIKDFLGFFGEIKYVNGLVIDSFELIMEKCKNIITQYYKTLDKYEYVVIHGDCNFSNILINPLDINDICFIDPRGYFGDSLTYGPKEYDYAKLLYAISGYDRFNQNFFNLKSFNKKDLSSSSSLNFEINPFYFDKKIINKYFNKIHKAFIVIIWLSLAEYNKNNIWKCLASYYYGLYLGTSLI